MLPQLLATTGPLSGRTLALQPGENTLGREAGNTIHIDDQTVSRRHARILVVNGSATLEDSGSSGGTFVNELRISVPTLLRVGDSIRIGSSVFSFLPPSILPPDLGQRKAREKSRYAEPAKTPIAPMAAPSSGAGCMPDVSQMMTDLQGCLGPLMKWLIIAAIVMLLLCLIGGIFVGCGLLATIGGSGAAAGAAGAAGGGGAGAAGGGDEPPPAQQQQQQQPPQQQAQQQQDGTAAIEIVKVRVAYLKREGYTQPQPVVLVTWRNRSQQAISELTGDIRGLDAGGRPVGLLKKATLYKGNLINPGDTHEDSEADGNVFPVDIAAGQAPPILDHAELKNLMVR